MSYKRTPVSAIVSITSGKMMSYLHTETWIDPSRFQIGMQQTPRKAPLRRKNCSISSRIAIGNRSSIQTSAYRLNKWCPITRVAMTLDKTIATESVQLKSLSKIVQEVLASAEANPTRLVSWGMIQRAWWQVTILTIVARLWRTSSNRLWGRRWRIVCATPCKWLSRSPH